MQKQSKITSKGQITVPVEIRRILGVKAGDRLLFESDSEGVRLFLSWYFAGLVDGGLFDAVLALAAVRLKKFIT